jgi:HSP20 family molecular chaperone IbpA
MSMPVRIARPFRENSACSQLFGTIFRKSVAKSRTQRYALSTSLRNGDPSMTEVWISRIQADGECELLLSRKLNALYDEVRRRAFQLFESRGSQHGHDVDDWLAAERSLVFAPSAELVEGDDQLEIRVAVEGYTAHQIRVSALPNEIVVDGDSSTSSVPRYLQIHFSEFNERKLLRRISVPQGVRPYTASAALKDGVLVITLNKVARDRGTGEVTEGAIDLNRHGGFVGSYPANAAPWRTSRRPAIKFSPIEPARISHIHMRIPGRRIPVR